MAGRVIGTSAGWLHGCSVEQNGPVLARALGQSLVLALYILYRWAGLTTTKRMRTEQKHPKAADGFEGVGSVVPTPCEQAHKLKTEENGPGFEKTSLNSCPNGITPYHALGPWARSTEAMWLLVELSHGHVEQLPGPSAP